MKRRDVLRHLHQHGCRFVREGGDHTVFENQANSKRSARQRHREIPDQTVKKFCKQLDIPAP